MTDRPAATTAADVAAFWRAAGYDRWFNKDEKFDAEIRARFIDVYEDAAAGRLTAWEGTAEGAWALLIVLDQFPRNMFRGEARMYATDAMAKAVAERAIARGFDQELAASERLFFYLPFMHSEALADQERCVALYRRLENAELLKFAEDHADIIRRFGRFPHRNAIFNRATTSEEQGFLDGGGFAG